MAIFKANCVEEFSPQLSALFVSHPQPRLGRDFNIRFWANYEPRRARYRGISGYLRQLYELEIEGIMVWRACASTLSGGAFCGLVLAVGMAFSSPNTLAKMPFPFPDQSYAYYAKEFDLSRSKRTLRV